MLLILDVAPTQPNQHILKETLFGHRAVVSVDSVPQHGKYPDNSSPSVSEGKLLTVGMIGFPNVGKSTLVDALLGRKQVSFFLLIATSTSTPTFTSTWTSKSIWGRIPRPNRMNFWKNSKRPLTPPSFLENCVANFL